MENASKAFLIAGGVLIAILILSIGIYMAVTFRQLGNTYEGITDENQIKKFNSNFTKFEGRTDITAQEIITTINLCKEYEVNYGITIDIAISNISGWSVSKINNDGEIAFITDCNNQNYKFSCTINYNDVTGLIEKATFTKTK